MGRGAGGLKATPPWKFPKGDPPLKILPAQPAKILQAIFAKNFGEKGKIWGENTKISRIFLKFSIFFAQHLKLILVTPVIITILWKKILKFLWPLPPKIFQKVDPPQFLAVLMYA